MARMKIEALLGTRLTAALALGAIALLFAPGAAAERIKDIAAVVGVRGNALVGYGLVVGLDGSGDQTSQAPFTVQSLKSMLAQFGVVLPPGVNPQLKNVAAVAVHAELPPFAKPGQRLDVTVSSIGNAKSLRGGTLLLTPLKGADGEVYALAQGNVVVGGFGVSGNDGSRVTVNVPSAGRIPNGAIVERVAPSAAFAADDHLLWQLHSPDFTTALRVSQAINAAVGEPVATALDGASVRVRVPSDPGERVAFVTTIENLTLEPGEAPARVVVNARTGTVVIGRHVRVTPAAITHGNLIVTITARPTVSQPPALSGGTTVVVPTEDIEVRQEKNRMFLFEPGVELGDIVRAINEVGAAPGDLVAILEALKQAGALRAELIVI